MEPNRILVFAVGIDSYKHQRMSLSGAAAYAERIADWALSCGVPESNIWLGSSRPTDNAADTRAVRRIDPTRAGIEDALVDASKFDADFLLLYWCGHGILHERRRAVFTSDVYDGSMRVHNVDAIQRYLASDTVTHLQNQLLVIDACANFYDDRINVPDRVISADSLNIGRDRTVNQFTLYSAGQGQTARFDKVTNSTEFSDTVLGWLEEHERLPLDPGSLTARVKHRFTELRTQRKFRQQPSICVITCLRDEEENWEDRRGIPVAGTVFHEFGGASLTPSHTRRATAALAELNTQLSNLDVRGALLSVVGGTSAAANLETHVLVAKVMLGNLIERFFDILEPCITTDIERFALLGIKNTWHRQRRIAEVGEFFDVVSAGQVTEAFWRSGAEPTNDGAPTELDTALDRCSEFESPVLHKFIVTLEHATGARVDDAWFDLPPHRLRALRGEARAHDGALPRVVIEIPNGTYDFESFTWPSSIGCHRYVPGLPSPWRPVEWHECEPTETGVRATVNQLVAATEQHCALGFIVPRAAFDEVPESWDFETIVDPATPHWVYRPTVLHCAERRVLHSVHANWKHKAESIRARLEYQQANLTWIPHSTSGEVRTWVRDSQSACFGMELASDKLDGKLQHDLLMAAINAGAPFIIWASPECESWSEVKLTLQRLIETGPFPDVPSRMHRSRETGSLTADNRVRLLWDDPAALPPGPMLRGMPRRVAT